MRRNIFHTTCAKKFQRQRFAALDVHPHVGKMGSLADYYNATKPVDFESKYNANGTCNAGVVMRKVCRFATLIFARLAMVIALLFPAMVFAADELCEAHKPDPVIDARAKDIALQLLAGLTSFHREFYAYRGELLNSPNSDRDTTELIIDLHCHAPQEVPVWREENSRMGFTIDTWRVKVNQAILDVATATDQNIAEKLAAIKDYANKIPKEDYDVFIADFNRTSLKVKLPYLAQKNAAGEIAISR